jgi:hypothetical protein
MPLESEATTVEIRVGGRIPTGSRVGRPVPALRDRILTR